MRPGRLAPLALLCACAHAAPRQRVDFQQPTVITAGPPSLAAPEDVDDATLFDMGTRAFEGGDDQRAARDFDALWQGFPRSPKMPAALWNAGLADERLGQAAPALERFEKSIQLEDEPEAQLHAALAEHALGRLDDAARRLAALARRPSLSPLVRGEALLQEGVCRVEQGQRPEGEQLLRAALDVWEKDAAAEAVDPALPAQAEYWLGEAYRGAFAARRLDPAAMDGRALGDALEDKAQLLLSAQGHYLRSIRRGDGEWATASGYRIGELYEAFHDELLAAPLPPGLDAHEQALYRSELRARVKNLVEKAIRIYEETLAAAQRTGARNGYVEKTAAALQRLRSLLLDAPQRVPPS